jgi:hypothetical protein
MKNLSGFINERILSKGTVSIPYEMCVHIQEIFDNTLDEKDGEYYKWAKEISDLITNDKGFWRSQYAK